MKQRREKNWQYRSKVKELLISLISECRKGIKLINWGVQKCVQVNKADGHV